MFDSIPYHGSPVHVHMEFLERSWGIEGRLKCKNIVKIGFWSGFIVDTMPYSESYEKE